MASTVPLFIKSVLPVQDTLKADDTSLALPTTDKITPSKSQPKDGSFRVQQQVQLTLSRKGKRAISNGSLSNNHISGTTAVGHGHVRIHSSLGEIGRREATRPSKRVDVSRGPSPNPPRARLGHGILRYSTRHDGPQWRATAYTLPVGRAPLTERFTKATVSQRSARSEVVRVNGSRASPHVASVRVTSQAGRPIPSDDVFLLSRPHGAPYLSEDRRAQGLQRQAGEASMRRSESLAWLSQLRRESRGPNVSKQTSDPASVVSMESDAGRRREVEEFVTQQATAQVTAQVNAQVKAQVTAQVNAQVTAKKGTPDGQVTGMTLEKAVSHLTQESTDMQVSAASFIQRQCFSSADAKRMVFYLHGIPKLLKLLQSDIEEVECAATSALRNVVHESNENKMEVKDCKGVPAILRLLKRTRDIETRRQLTGLLWNLSSHDILKEHLSREAVKPLTDYVVVPCSGLSEGDNPKEELLADLDVFYNATGCLRNISSAGPDGRKAMRECEGLIDSLVYYVRGTIADYKPDDKATENSVCILHNLSYQMEAELPQKHAPEFQESRQTVTTKTKTPGCFVIRSAEIAELQHSETHCPLLEKANPHGMEWLWSAITIRMYLSLIARSNHQQTQEASVGALQNLTGGGGAISQAIAQTLVRREGGLLQARNLLQDGGNHVKRITVSLLRNVSRYSELHADVVKQVLPELIAMLPNTHTAMEQPAEVTEQPAEVTVALLHTLISLSQTATQNVRAIVNHGALPKIINISTKNNNGYGPTRPGQAACILLHTMWSHSELRGAYRKAGYRKADFVNSRTTKAVNVR